MADQLGLSLGLGLGLGLGLASNLVITMVELFPLSYRCHIRHIPDRSFRIKGHYATMLGLSYYHIRVIILPYKDHYTTI